MSDILGCINNTSASCYLVEIRTHCAENGLISFAPHGATAFLCVHTQAQLKNWWTQLTRQDKLEMSCTRMHGISIGHCLQSWNVTIMNHFLSILLRTPNMFFPFTSMQKCVVYNVQRVKMYTCVKYRKQKAHKPYSYGYPSLIIDIHN